MTPPFRQHSPCKRCTNTWTASDAEFLMMNLEDFWLEAKPQNIPGTHGGQRPNWRRRAAKTLEEFRTDETLRGQLERIHQLREKSS